MRKFPRRVNRRLMETGPGGNSDNLISVIFQFYLRFRRPSRIKHNIEYDATPHTHSCETVEINQCEKCYNITRAFINFDRPSFPRDGCSVSELVPESVHRGANSPGQRVLGFVYFILSELLTGRKNSDRDAAASGAEMLCISVL